MAATLICLSCPSAIWPFASCHPPEAGPSAAPAPVRGDKRCCLAPGAPAKHNGKPWERCRPATAQRIVQPGTEGGQEPAGSRPPALRKPPGIPVTWPEGSGEPRSRRRRRSSTRDRRHGQAAAAGEPPRPTKPLRTRILASRKMRTVGGPSGRAASSAPLPRPVQPRRPRTPRRLVRVHLDRQRDCRPQQQATPGTVSAMSWPSAFRPRLWRSLAWQREGAAAAECAVLPSWRRLLRLCCFSAIRSWGCYVQPGFCHPKTGESESPRASCESGLLSRVS